MEIKDLLNEYNEIITKELDRLLPMPGEDNPCHSLISAMRYALDGGGKRIRPALTFEFCKACGGKKEDALPFAAAIEMIHTYSLIHDDLPCMDNDDLRRGRPTVHKAYPEDTALLAGDALNTMAFEVILQSGHKNAAAAGLLLAKSAGKSGMIAGQVMDLALENQENVQEELLNLLEATHNNKTGALISAACIMGCLAADGTNSDISAATEYAAGIGLAFQIMDDILDVVGDEALLGKPIGSDAVSHKTTFTTLMSVDEALKYAGQLTEDAKTAARKLKSANMLVELADFLANRNY